MAKYQIGKEVKELTSKAGNGFKKFNVKDEKGVLTLEVVAFPTFSGYKNVISGGTVDGVLKEGDYKGAKSYSLVDGNLGPRPSGFGKVAMEMKSAGIQKAQERKEDGIMVSSTARDATLILTTFYPELGAIADQATREKEIVKLWRKYRRLLLDNWEPKATTSDGELVPDFDVPTGYPDSFVSAAEQEVNDFSAEEIPF